nr:reverse transcriptase domain-containing protein [Tanacetum cinerariifolium]
MFLRSQLEQRSLSSEAVGLMEGKSHGLPGWQSMNTPCASLTTGIGMRSVCGMFQPPVVPISIPKPNVPRTQTKPTIPYPSRLNDQKLREKAMNPMEKFFQIFHDLHFDISFTDALLLMPKFASTIKSLLMNKDKLFELAKVGKFHFPTDFVVVDFNADPRVPLILRRSFLITGRDLIDVYGEEITLRVNDESVTFNLNQTM